MQKRQDIPAFFCLKHNSKTNVSTHIQILQLIIQTAHSPEAFIIQKLSKPILNLKAHPLKDLRAMKKWV
ncbi:hypothetical protein [Vibrio cyclitrophicus]|uniref:hypothetical protein n=1 Tax=Vibrio cyclitrophicus TaxID=47951 RepID=UPI0003815A0F|nr:hypothetical protein [Vibrio cyclitrophicus]OED78060.1 hypothetical protein OAS_09445 [Vibrio cyclitrophicus ZF65]OEF39395.1 hypothetical protein OAC_12840 [Vibrio cyclitrophicus 1F273]OEF80326.1 hypothetical protein OA5_12385 [Vibrio cyclitrophicus 1F111]OCH38395.1 hypothetical protein A6E07_01700 [Vibrio cyclitrophicus]PME11169.1 hypothetical protein BCV43_20570 [Vibrio cyclitrophicus]